MCNKITLTENLITYLSQIIYFVIIYTDKNNTIITQQIFCQLQSRIYHIQPISMKTTVTLSISNHLIPFFIILATIILVFRSILLKFIAINKVITCIIRRIDINHLHLAQIRFLQQLQHFQIVAFNIKVFRIVKVNAFFSARAQGFVNRRIGSQNSSALIRPSKLVAFLQAIYNMVTKLLFQHIKINGMLQFALFIDSFCNAIRE